MCTGPCTTGDCDPGHGCQPRPAGTLCRPAMDSCDVAERCDGARSECPADAAQAATASRDDGNACTTGDHCSGSGKTCVAGADRLRCDDGNGCTDDACGPTTGCTHTPNAAPCDDGDRCTDDLCAAGACHGTPLPGYDLAACELSRPMVGPPCDAASLPNGLNRLIVRRQGRAQLLLQRAAGSDRPARQRRFAVAADGILGTIERRVTRAIGRGEASAACGAAIERTVRAQRQLLSALQAAPGAAP